MALQLSPLETNIYRIVQAVIELIAGRSNAVGSITLTPGAVTTVVTTAQSRGAINVALDSVISLTPRTLNAAAALATTYISAVGQGTFTITHANNAQVDRTFDWSARG